ncbi:MAG: lysylphosphatidylglycerol synthase domain-containing protein [Halofilum sp. (in: g-proteobacteria)]|nr:lysylphosphatidylglycerol synthase domain-containing protein [Halofilum sp. (in: g-proteobacteria)]
MKIIARLNTPRVRRFLLLTQVIVAPVGLVTLVWLLMRELPLVALREAAVAVAASFGLALLGYGLFAIRLSRVLDAFSIRLRRASLWRIHLTSLFYYFFLPAGVGYDLSKVAKISLQARDTRTMHVTAAVAAERAVGGAGVYLLLLGTLPFTELDANSRIEWLAPPAWAWVLSLLTGVALMWLVSIIGRRSHSFRIAPLIPAVLVSAIAHLMVAAAVWVVSRSLGIPIGFPEIVVAFAATLLLQLVPVNLLGVTLGEVAAVTVYLAYGLDEPEALLLATVAYSHRLIPAMLGGVIEGASALRTLRHTSGPTESVHDIDHAVRD